MEHVKRIVDNKMRDYGEESDKGSSHLIRVNKTLSKKDPSSKRPVNAHAYKYPDVLDSEVHEEMHASHPKMTEKAVWKKTRRKMSTMKPEAKKKIYKRYD